MSIAKLLHESIILSLVLKTEILVVTVEQLVAFLSFAVSALAYLRAR